MSAGFSASNSAFDSGTDGRLDPGATNDAASIDAASLGATNDAASLGTSNNSTRTEPQFRRRAKADPSRTYIPSAGRSTPPEPNENTEAEDVALERTLGLWSGISFIAGTMIGSGIFVSPTGVINKVGSAGLSLIVWFGCGVLALLGSLCYAELGVTIPKSGGEYAYFLRIFGGKERKRAGDVIAYLFSWVLVTMIKPSSLAIISLVFAEYLAVPMFDDCGPPDIVKKLLATTLMVALTILNCVSVSGAAKVQIVFTVAKIVALILIIVAGFVKLGQGHSHFLSPSSSFSSSSSSPSSIALAFYSGLWAYDGWNQLNYVTEEIVNPRRNLPLSIGLGIPLVTALYLAVNVAYFAALSPAEVRASGSTAVAFGDRALGPLAPSIPFFVAASCVGAANGSLFTAGRSVFVAAREGHIPRLLSMVQTRFLTPLPALASQCLLATLMAFAGGIDSLIDFFSFAVWAFYALAFLANVLMRLDRFMGKDPAFLARPLKLPVAVPVVCLAASAFLVVAPIVEAPALEFLYAFLFIVAGLIFYVPFVWLRLRWRFVDDLTAFLQLLMGVAPPKGEVH